jgi:drug/metabolite transporter (DMT)-like permease
MAATRISGFLFLAGLFGILAVLLFGHLPTAEYLLGAAFTAIALAGLIILGYVVIETYREFTKVT